MEPYYTAAYALYKLEYLFRNAKLEAKYKPTRFHILLAARRLAAADALPAMSSNEMEKYCKPLMNTLWDSTTADELLASAVKVVDDVAAGEFDRDKIRTESFTKNVINRCKELNASPATKGAN
jgi:hypothetical protein